MSDPAQQPQQYPPQYPQNPGQQMPPNAPPQQPYPGMAGQPGMPPQPKPKSKRRFIGLAILLVVVAVVGIGGWIASRDAAGSAKQGDCVQQTGANDLKVVKCDDAKADFKVVGRVEDKNQTETDSACAAYKDAESSYWEGESGKKGLVLCLAPLK